MQIQLKIIAEHPEMASDDSEHFLNNKTGF